MNTDREKQSCITKFLCCLAFLTAISLFDYIEQTFSVNSRKFKIKLYHIKYGYKETLCVYLIICFFCDVGIFTIALLPICNNLNFVEKNYVCK